MVFNQEERMFMVEEHLATKSFTQWIELFVINSPNSVPPNKSSISQVVSKFRSTGNLRNQLKVCAYTVLTIEKLVEIKDVFETELYTSLLFYKYTIFPTNYTFFVAFFWALFAFFIFVLRFKWHTLYKNR